MKLRGATRLLRQDGGFPGGNAGASLKPPDQRQLQEDHQRGFPGGNRECQRGCRAGLVTGSPTLCVEGGATRWRVRLPRCSRQRRSGARPLAMLAALRVAAAGCAPPAEADLVDVFRL